MSDSACSTLPLLSVVMPCYNEARTLAACLRRVLAVQDETFRLEVIVVDDHSTDGSEAIAEHLAAEQPCIQVVRHPENRGKGAALRTGIQRATGEIVAIQDADLEYNPRDLKRLIRPIRSGEADVVLGTRFALSGAHRVLYFWHYLGNRFLTLLSNIFSDLNLTDMECCYKAFKREVIQAIDIQENRFGVEPELVAKVAQMKLRIYEMGVSYAGRTYEEGKKIGIRDGFRALFCILRYGAFQSPALIQLLAYAPLYTIVAAVNLILFLSLRSFAVRDLLAQPAAFFLAGILNYFICLALLFRHRVRWSACGEAAVYGAAMCLGALLDGWLTFRLMQQSTAPWLAKMAASLVGWFYSFAVLRYLVCPEQGAAGPGKTRHSA